MEFYTITINLDKEIRYFQIGEYLHQDGERCKYKVFQHGKLVASFEPDNYGVLHVCQNPAELNEELLHLLADQIEAHYTVHSGISPKVVQDDFNGLGTA